LSLAIALAACHAEEAQQGPRKLSQGSVTLSGASLDYLRVEPVAKPSTTVQRPLLSRVSFDEQRVAVLGAPVSGRVCWRAK
jgi:hypothetical protein